MDKNFKSQLLWQDRKRWTFFGLPWTFTRYAASKERLFISKGFLNVKDDEVRLYRVMDISLTRSLGQRIFGLGTVRVCSADRTLGDFELVNIKHPMATKELLSDLVEKQREIKRVVHRENMVDSHEAYDFEPEDFAEDDAPFDR
ncbi:MAG: PH domain-containing protein [Eubacteriales bacterium]|nr:PH domain-containing protein [Eubacteriales bacterium]